MLNRTTNFFVYIFDRYLPDPLVIVAFITFFIFAIGVVAQGHSPADMLGYWQGGFWGLLSFAMQMALVLVLGYTVASAPLFKAFTQWIAGFARTPGAAIVIVTLVSLAASWLNWGIGLVIGAILGRELARRVPGVDYRLLIASAYSGFLIWHGGLSGSIPLLIANPGHFLEDQIGLIPTDQTIFSTLNIAIVLGLFVVVPLTNWWMMRGIAEPVMLNVDLDDEAPKPVPVSEQRPAERLESSRPIALAIAAMGLAAVVLYWWRGTGGLNLDVVNFTLLFLGIALHGTLGRYLATFTEGTKGAAAILVQFPFYAGIMGMMGGSGLTEAMSNFFIDIASAGTLPVLTFFAAGLVNLFVPSGGGQWAVQGPVMMEAALALNADLARVAMAVAWGDAWTNMIQPFWALPALAIAGLRARDIMGFCVMVLFTSGAVIALGFLLF